MTRSPEILYHYTDTVAMLNILQRGELWATDANYLNDSNELQHGRNELYSALTAKQVELGEHVTRGGHWRGTDLGILRAELEYHAKGESLQLATGGPFVSCFCEDGDLLSQWRGYAGGSGWAIGFAREWLESVCYRRGRPQALRQVVYGVAGIGPMVERVLAEQTIDPLARKGPSWGQAREICDTGLAGIKDDAFVEEREWRLILQGAPGGEQFRPGRVGLTPYLKVPFPKEAIKEVVIGPSVYSTLQWRAAARLLEGIFGLTRSEDGDVGRAVKLRSSAAPYR